MSTTYEVQLTFGKLYVAADFSNAAAQIYSGETPDDLTSTRYQVADSRHSPQKAAILAVLESGSDYYLDPADTAKRDELGDEKYVESLIVSVRPL